MTAPDTATPEEQLPETEPSLTPSSEADAIVHAADTQATELPADPAPAENKTGGTPGEKTQPVYADPVAELVIIDPIVLALSAKQTTDINSIGNRLGEIRKQLSEQSESAKARGVELHQHMVELLAQNKAHQEEMSAKAHAAIETLKESLEAGNSEASLSAWDKVQAALGPLSGKLRNAVQKQLNEHRVRYQELKDWKLFASAEKKKELITAMQLLLESDTQGGERAKAISAAHQEWKSLGRSQQNESLWKKFKKLSDEAYAPCKDHFKQRKNALVENYEQRLLLCDELEAELSRLSAPAPTENTSDSDSESKAAEQKLSAEIARLVSAAEERWKATAPVEQSKIKELQKRYYAVLNALRKLRREAGQENAQRKQSAIALAEALAASEDRGEAMRGAKELQRQWKEIGPSNHKDDQAYWKAFRAACDKIFARDESGAERGERPRRDASRGQLDTGKASAEANSTLDALESLLALKDEDFRQARDKYQDLSQAFSAALDPRLGNRRKPLTERFNTLKRRFDTRYKSLPDKRQQQRIATVTLLSAVLDKFEKSLLEASTADAFATSKDAFDHEAWKGMERPDDVALVKVLEARLDALSSATDAKTLSALSTQAEQQARRLCTELEISANAETPKEDQALRMQLQLEQLKAAFGQTKQSAADIIKHARDEQLRLQCLGPMSLELRNQLSERFATAAAKLGRA
jgi:exonuclease SbcC